MRLLLAPKLHADMAEVQGPFGVAVCVRWLSA